jgi:poly(hydroxyalkanoate) granule-associated protein
MARLKKKNTNASGSAKGGAARNNAAELQAKAEQMSRSLRDSAQQIWMAGVGAFTRAQGEGSKLFEALVKEGMNIEQHTRKLAGGRVDAVRDAVEDRVGVVRERASDTWDRLEKVFEERVQRALNRLGVPSREDLTDLTGRVETLTGELRRIGGRPAASRAAAAPKVKTIKVGTIKTKNTPARAPAKPAAAKAKAAERKRPAARKPARTLPKAPRPVAPQS